MTCSMPKITGCPTTSGHIFAVWMPAGFSGYCDPQSSAQHKDIGARGSKFKEHCHDKIVCPNCVHEYPIYKFRGNLSFKAPINLIYRKKTGQ